MGALSAPAFAQVAEATTAAGGNYEITLPNATTSTFYQAVSGSGKSAVLFEGVKWRCSPRVPRIPGA